MPYVNTHNRNIRFNKRRREILQRGQEFGMDSLTDEEQRVYEEVIRKRNSFENPIHKKYYVIREGKRWILKDSSGNFINSSHTRSNLVKYVEGKYRDRMVIVSKDGYEPYDGNYTVEVL